MPAAIAFFLGVLLLQQFAQLPQPQWLALIVLLGLLLWRRAFWLTAFLLGLGYAAIHASLMLSVSLPSEFESVDLLAEGRVASLPVSFERRTRFEFQIDSLRHQDKRIDFAAKVRLSWYGKKRPVIQAGDVWRLQVRLKRPHGFANPGTFDYEAWLWREGIRATGYVRKSEHNRRLGDSGWLDLWPRQRQHFSTILAQAVPDDALPLLAALIIGERSAFSREQWQLFRETGTNHLVAISGLHIGMVAGLLLLVTGWLWRRSARLCLWWPAPRAAALAALIGAGFYAGLAGFAIPTQRALIMLLMLLLPRLLGRQGRPWQGLGYALILVLLLDPASVQSPGFILSFAAVGAILWALGVRPDRESWLITLVRMQFAVLLVVTPLLILLFNQASLMAFPVNLIAVPWFSFVLVPLAFVGALLLLLAPPLGEWLLGLVAPLYGWSLAFLEYAAALGPGLLELAQRPVWLVLAACLGGVWLLSPLRAPARYLGLLLIWPLAVWREQPPLEGQFEATLLDVGQGLAVVVRTANHLLLYDTGPAFSKTFNAGSAVVTPFLKSRGIGRIDRLVISHKARDHAGGAAAVLAALPVTAITAHAGLKLPELKTEPCRAGSGWTWDGVEFLILHPEDSSAWNSNNSSCVVLVRSGAAALLLTGDLERQGESALLAQHAGELQGAVVQVGHHGSKTSSSQALVDATATPLALVSSGYRNPFGFPAAEVVERWQSSGADVLDTVDSGAIKIGFEPDDGVASVQRWRTLQQRPWQGAQERGSEIVYKINKLIGR